MLGRYAMWRFFAHRLIWSLPTLALASVLSFLLTTLVPVPSVAQFREDPARVFARDQSEYFAVLEERARLFLDLPTFLNPRPRDVRRRTRDCAIVVAADVHDRLCAAWFARIGTAALPSLFADWPSLAPETRRRIGEALLPVASRTGVVSDFEDIRSDPALFWEQFWQERSTDFTDAAARRAVARFVELDTEMRQRELIELDTYALEAIVNAIASISEPFALYRLSRLASERVQLNGVIDPNLAPDERAKRVRFWKAWWLTHRSEYVELDGTERVFSTLTETRYGKWLRQVVLLDWGESSIDGVPVRTKLLRRAPKTILLASSALFFAFAFAVPVAVLSALLRGRRADAWLSAALFFIYATPTFFLASALSRIDAGPSGRTFFALVALSLTSFAGFARLERASLLDALSQDYVRTARSKGLSMSSVVLRHALRNALSPLVAFLGVHFPVLFGSALVVESVFGIRGIGLETVRAMQAHDTAWLAAVLMLTAVGGVLSMSLSDIGTALIDPRARLIRDAHRSGN